MQRYHQLYANRSSNLEKKTSLVHLHEWIFDHPVRLRYYQHGSSYNT